VVAARYETGSIVLTTNGCNLFGWGFLVNVSS
jgi:hypothetical protein